MPVSARLASLAVEPGGQRVKLALLARRKDLLVAWLDLLVTDWPAFVLLLQPTGERLSIELKGSHRPEAYSPERFSVPPSELPSSKLRLNQQMKRVLLAGLLPVTLLGCGGGVDWEKPWLDSNGKTVPTNQIVSTYRGPDHCEWDSAVFLNLGWPPGTYAEYPSSSARQYVRDPEGLFESEHLAPLDLDVKLPPDARYTGYHLDEIELWIRSADADEAVYIVRPERVERWPRLARHTICA